MTNKYLARLRQHHQHLHASAFERPDEVVAWFGAMQAQDYPAAKWAIAQRAPGLTNDLLDQAFAKGEILRTHVLRPTWHFVTPADIRWLLQVSAQYVHKLNAYYYRRVELDPPLFHQAADLFVHALQGGNRLTRTELALELEQARISIGPDNLRLTYLVLYAELEGIICSGGLCGKQHTYALLDERAPEGQKLSQDEALARLTERYFRSHGPATLKDFAWWSSLPMTEAGRGVEALGPQLYRETLDGQDYWSADPGEISFKPAGAILLPNYDEYIVGYTDRNAIFNEAYAKGLDARHNPLFQHTVVIDGEILGTWKSKLLKRQGAVTATTFIPLSSEQQHFVAEEIERYGEFMNKPMQVIFEM